MAGERARYQGSPKALAEALLPVVQPLGRSWLKYGESQLRQGAAVNADLIKAAHPVLSVLHDQQPNLAFTKKLITDVVTLLYDQNACHPAWRCREEDTEAYKTAMVARFNNICRAVIHGQRKHPKCFWVRSLPWFEGASEAPAEATSSDAPCSFIYGWDTVLCTAWRAAKGTGSRQKCLATEIRVPEGAAPCDPVQAVFVDGSTWSVSDITCQEYTALAEAPRRGKGDSLWSSTHTATQHSLRICYRRDRRPLYVLHEQRKQVLQISISRCSSAEKALEIITCVAEGFASNTFTREQLAGERDRLMTTMDAQPSKAEKKAGGRTFKKPAAPEHYEEEELQEAPVEEEEEVQEQKKVQSQADGSWFDMLGPPSSDDDWLQVRFLSIIHHQMVEDDGLVDPAALVDATELAGKAGEVSPAEAAPHSLCGILRGVRLLLDDPASLLDGADETMLEDEMALNSKRTEVMSSYAPQRLHRCLFDPEQAWTQDRFDPLFWAARQAGTEEALKGLVREEAWDVYSLPFFTPDFCDMFIEEIYNFYASGLPARRPNSMNNYGVVVNEIGMEQALDRLQQEFLLPVASALFRGVGSYFDGHHSFIVRYKVGEDLGLDLHTDDSDVTFNICLGKDFRGAGLRFCGNQGSAHHRHASALYFHEKGRCAVHLGHRRHGADDITEGERLNLIIWNKNSEYRRSKAFLRYNMQARDTYERESGPPDKVCLSYTHDRDYGVFTDYAAKTQTSRGRGWCPPRHAEYEGFREEVPA